MLKKLLFRLAIFFILLVLLDIILGSAIRYVYFKQNHGVYYRTTYVFERATPDIMILGSSKASHHYIAKTMQDSLKTSCYNGGRDGHFIQYSNAAVNSILKRYSPKIIVLDVIDDEFEVSSYKLQDKLSGLLPYYKTHPEIRPIVELKSPLEKYKLLSGMYTFNSLLLPSITGALDLNNKKDAEKTLGYLPWFDKWEGELKVVDSRNEKLDTIKINAFKNIVSACKEKNIKLIVVISPTYKKYVQNYNPTINLITGITTDNKIPFWNYTLDTTYLNNKSYFHDIRHMNNNGAKIFTEAIISQLKNTGNF